MSEMGEQEKKKIIQKYPHLIKYLEKIKTKVKEPVFYSTL